MGDCNFGHAKVPIIQESVQGACCDEKHYHNFEKGLFYPANSPLTIIPDSVPRTYTLLTASDQEFCGLRTCKLDLTEAEEDCVASVCTKARNLITQTVAWPAAFTDDDVEIVRANPKCCFELIGAPCCNNPELPGCEEEAEPEGEAK